jgi:hypothetical protein
MGLDKKESKEIMGIDEFRGLIKLSRNAVLNAIKDGRIESAYKDDDGVWQFDVDRCLVEYNMSTAKSKSRNFDDGGPRDFGPVTDEQIERRRSVFTIPEDKWTEAEAKQAESIFDALEAKLRYEAKQGKFYPKEDTDKKFLKSTKMFADGLKRIPDDFRQRVPEIPPKQFKVLEKLIEELRKEISKALCVLLSSI